MNTPLKNDAAPSSPDEILSWFAKVRYILAEGKLVEFSPKGYSMWPALQPGRDTVVIGPATAYSTGDIVLALCDSPHGVTLHRIARSTSGHFTLMGDANLFQTETCPQEAIAGKVLSIIRDGRDISRSRSTRILGTLQRLPASMRRIVVRILNISRK